MRRMALFLLVLLVPFAALAEVPDNVWNALLERDVIIARFDGSEVQGRLIGVDLISATVMKGDGNVVSVDRNDVEEVRGAGAAAARPKPEVDSPLGKYYFLFNPLGFLQVGPILEFGAQVAPETTLGGHLRFAGLGLLYNLLTVPDEEGGYVSLLSMAAGGTVLHFFPGGRPGNRFYAGGMLEFGWGATGAGEDTSWEWEGRHKYIAVMANVGHRWRYPSGFFLNVGLIGGLASIFQDDWWEIDTPSVVHDDGGYMRFYGAVELSIGKEF